MKKRFNERMFGKIFLFGVLFLTAISFVIMALWNNILVPLLHIGVINFWQSLGIFVLSKILFGGFRGGHWGRHRYWKNKMSQRWADMTPEEREKFKQEWRDRCRGSRFGQENPFEEKREAEAGASSETKI
ncbi:MAG TPA: hypothetical protein VFV08_13740 [Puia sp.]|nr:hypothetical protein [Puia sp.]